VDPSHFARFFRKATGVTPQDFRAGQVAHTEQMNAGRGRDGGF
jgi:AraC-like DNA-binding protein